MIPSAGDQQKNYQAIADDVVIGEGTRLSRFINLYGCTIGDDSMIGPFVEIQRGASVGSKCKVSSHVFICEGVSIGDRCFIGHGVMFTNDKTPRATNAEGEPQTADDWTVIPTFVEDDVSIGSGATLLPGITIGRGAMVGAGATVTRDVAPFTLVVGTPAREAGPVPDSDALGGSP
ncbi:MAG: N-acetyltransferase [Armatimonadetes bacterium]|nr:MAG: N-acetyltransferase [Armatimonadota bacterium]